MSPADLVPHRPYFFCGYFTDAESVPSIETYIYLGLASEVLGSTTQKREHIFQDAECYFRQQRGELSSTASPADRGFVLIADEDLLKPMVQDYAGLLEFINRCKQDARE
jgi:hypothetical protein